MPTPAERKALVFLTGLLVLGTGARMHQATAHASVPSLESQQALRQQVAAVDSARDQASKKKRKGGGRVVVRASRGATALPSPAQREEVVMRRVPVTGVPAYPSVLDAPSVPGGASALAFGPLDLDRATEVEIERLPRIGPVLARRIVADRDSLGPFGSLEGFQRVRGVGKALAKRLAPYVTFSLQPRPSAVLDRRPAAVAGRKRRRPPGSG